MCTHVCVFVSVCACMHACVRACVCICVHVCVRVCVHACVRVCTCTSMQTGVSSTLPGYVFTYFSPPQLKLVKSSNEAVQHSLSRSQKAVEKLSQERSTMTAQLEQQAL